MSGLNFSLDSFGICSRTIPHLMRRTAPGVDFPPMALADRRGGERRLFFLQAVRVGCSLTNFTAQVN
jgi:hypothetical protein